ncbi:MAG TPA: EamA family transporter [Xanthobacteraceae bacterium]|nr:EamA family transporter [Xanthobacteraceae bacterium]
MNPPRPTLRATLIGLAAIALWSLLALLTAASGPVPPFQLAAMTFAIGGALGAAGFALRSCGFRLAITRLGQPVAVWALGVSGLFGYHALYFTALKTAPPAEAGLLNYLWPLLIVLLSGLLPGERLRLHHVAGALAGLAGTILIFTGGRDVALATDHIPGFAAAFVAAFVWSSYSVLMRRFAAVPTDMVAGFCLVTAVLSGIFHLIFEETVWICSPYPWMAVMALGLGPVGLAFYAWDFGIKHGDIRVLGALSYAAPVLSTAALVLAGYAEPTPTLGIAAALIAGGGALAAKDLFTARPLRRATKN